MTAETISPVTAIRFGILSAGHVMFEIEYAQDLPVLKTGNKVTKRFAMPAAGMEQMIASAIEAMLLSQESRQGGSVAERSGTRPRV